MIRTESLSVVKENWICISCKPKVPLAHTGKKRLVTLTVLMINKSNTSIFAKAQWL